jgi:hypothetical protein
MGGNGFALRLRMPHDLLVIASTYCIVIRQFLRLSWPPSFVSAVEIMLLTSANFLLLEGCSIVGIDRYRNKEDSSELLIPFLRINHAHRLLFQPYIDLIHGDSPPHRSLLLDYTQYR